MKKGFTLIELIVVIAVVGILVALGTSAYKGYTEEAKRAEYLSNIKVLENASEQYYLATSEWPRATDEHYTSAQIETYGDEVLSRTGQHVELDPDGKYYDIDYSKLSRYTQTPKDKSSYIIQNPVGDILMISGINDEGMNRSPVTEVVEEVEEIEWVIGNAGQGTSITMTDINGRVANIGKTSGKWYWEISISSTTFHSYGLGIGSKGGLHPVYGVNIHAYPGGGIRLTKGNYWDVPTAFRYNAKETIGVILDIDNDILKFRSKHGEVVSPHKPSQLGITEYYAYVCNNSGGERMTYSANFGDQPFVFSQPEGFRAYNLVEKNNN